MSFKARLKIDGKEVDILDWNYSLNRDVDQKGRPSSHVYGGTISFVVESTSDTAWFDWMIDQWAKKDGEVEFMDRAEEQPMRTLSFKEAYIIQLTESFSNAGDKNMNTAFTLSCKSLGWGGGMHENEWPM